MKIKTLVISLMLLLVCGSYAQTVSYSYKPLAEEGCCVDYSIAKQNSVYSIIVKVTSNSSLFLKEATMLLKTFDGEIIKLHGTAINVDSQSTNHTSGNMNSTAQFIATPAQLESLKKGISKIRLSTSPIEHEREFKKDKIGKKLYQLFLKQKDKDNNF
ncbi:hypothetical protein prwr041_07930 [Prevotella herbatica]|uniref:Uncharacterized protein n=1 Tax=Prevotella herbatica TaxID=2801997 RepID=A0ABM7NWS7_9BACT|nr:hypothetical protein [Prevotella herbatica]BCS84900.1 hypothetical protein prwr041_07930 [Prevotella herbatica]